MVADNLAGLKKGIASLESQQVLVGVPAEKTNRDPDATTGKRPEITNAALAYIHNYGSPTQNIPARPFLEVGIKEGEAKIVPRMAEAGKAALGGDPGLVMKNLHAVGQTAQLAVQLKIQRGPFAPLDPKTLAARRRHGRTGTRPLIDTSQMLQHISYAIRARGK